MKSLAREGERELGGEATRVFMEHDPRAPHRQRAHTIEDDAPALHDHGNRQRSGVRGRGRGEPVADTDNGGKPHDGGSGASGDPGRRGEGEDRLPERPDAPAQPEGEPDSGVTPGQEPADGPANGDRDPGAAHGSQGRERPEAPQAQQPSRGWRSRANGPAAPVTPVAPPVKPRRARPFGGGILMGRPFGVPVYVAPSWFLVAALITWVFGGQLDRVLPELGSSALPRLAVLRGRLLRLRPRARTGPHRRRAALQAAGTPHPAPVLRRRLRDREGGRDAGPRVRPRLRRPAALPRARRGLLRAACRPWSPAPCPACCSRG